MSILAGIIFIIIRLWLLNHFRLKKKRNYLTIGQYFHLVCPDFDQISQIALLLPTSKFITMWPDNDPTHALVEIWADDYIVTLIHVYAESQIKDECCITQHAVCLQSAINYTGKEWDSACLVFVLVGGSCCSMTGWARAVRPPDPWPACGFVSWDARMLAWGQGRLVQARGCSPWWPMVLFICTLRSYCLDCRKLCVYHAGDVSWVFCQLWDHYRRYYACFCCCHGDFLQLFCVTHLPWPFYHQQLLRVD